MLSLVNLSKMSIYSGIAPCNHLLKNHFNGLNRLLLRLAVVSSGLSLGFTRGGPVN
jgi:hypothetical protein